MTWSVTWVKSLLQTPPTSPFPRFLPSMIRAELITTILIHIRGIRGHFVFTLFVFLKPRCIRFRGVGHFFIESVFVSSFVFRILEFTIPPSMIPAEFIPINIKTY